MKSRDPLDHPLHGVAVYNPDLLSKQELIAHFVTRRALLDRLVEDLGREGVTQHHLIIGQRGMGKTTLLRRLRHAVEDDPALDRQWIPLTFPEEQYNISRLSDLYLNCIDALGDALEQRGRHAEARKLDDAVGRLPDKDEPERAARALDLLLTQADKLGRRLLLLVDNLDLIFDRLKAHQWGIRELLSSEKRLLLIGASAAPMEITYKYKEPFYDFFQSHELRGLTEEETREVLLNLARLDQAVSIEKVIAEDPARIRTLHVLTGGNPRTIVLLYNMLSQGTDGDVRSDLERLLDQCTPLYKARFESLPTQAQQIVAALAVHWDPFTAGDLAETIHLETNTVSSQLNRLAQQGVVEKVTYHPSNKAGFQIAERFFNIWYLMRASRRVRRRLIWLVEFLKLLYSNDEMHGLAKQHLLHSNNQRDADNRLRHAEYGLALAQAVKDAPLRNALENRAIHELVTDNSLRRKIGKLIDLTGADASLKPVADRHQAAAELQEAIKNAKIKWLSIDPEHFATLLGGSPSLNIDQKFRVLIALEPRTSVELKNILTVMTDELNSFAKTYRSEAIARQLWIAIRDGYMTDAKDITGAETASLCIGSEELSIVTLAMAADENVHGNDTDTCTQLSKATTPFPFFIIGNILRNLPDRIHEAEAAYRKAIELDSTYSLPWNNLGNLYQENLNRFDEAETAYHKAIDLDPMLAVPWNNLGNLYKDKLCRFDEAEAAYIRSIELDPTSSDTWNNLGSLLQHNTNRFNEAETAYRKAIELDPACAFSWSSLGDLYADDLDRSGEAEAVYLKLININSSDALSWLKLGSLYQHKLNRLDDAEAAYRKATDLNPQNAFMWHMLGNLLFFHLERLYEAKSAYRKAMELNPSDASNHVNTAWLLYQIDQGDPDAEQAARQAAKLAPDDTFVLFTFATILAYRGHWAEASPLARRFLSEDSPKFHDKLSSYFLFFQAAVQTSHAADAVALLDELDLTDRYRPLREALAAIAAGTRAYLRRIAPEIRQPAESLIDELYPAGLD